MCKVKDDKTGVCVKACTDQDGKSKINATEGSCMCKTTLCANDTYCNNASTNGTCQVKPTCANDNGSIATSTDCLCGATATCETNQFCKKTSDTEHKCLFSKCVETGATDTICGCGNDNCAIGDTCTKDGDNYTCTKPTACTNSDQTVKNTTK